MTEKIFTKAQNEIFNELYQIDVNQNVEQKNKLNYDHGHGLGQKLVNARTVFLM